MNLDRIYRFVDDALSGSSPARAFGTALLGMLVLGIIDYFVGVDISLFVFYLGPVGIATWYAGRSAGVLIAFLAAVTALIENFIEGDFLRRPGVTIWNGFLHLGTMLVIVSLLNRLRGQIQHEQKLARTDLVTGILNRRAFMEHLRYNLDLAARERTPITLAYIDLDDFKNVNDHYGHDEGDKILRCIANALKESIRRTDISARLGGDEFAVLLVGANRTSAQTLMLKVRQRLHNACDAERSMVTCSIGCITFQEAVPGPDSAIEAADILMYKVKKQGKNAIAFDDYNPKLNT